MIKYSFIIPMYNSEQYIEKCLLTILKQKPNNYEIVVIDDGSTDNSFQIIEKYLNNNVRCIRTKNYGISHARNLGIDNSIGQYIIFVDSDDEVEADMLSKIDDYLLKNDTDIIKFQVNCEDVNKNNRFHSPVFNNLNASDALKILCDKDKIFATPWMYCIKKTIFTDNNLFFVEGKLHEDLGLIPNIILNAKTISSLEFYGYKYIKRENSTVTSNTFDAELSRINDFIFHYKNLMTSIDNSSVSEETKNIFKKYFSKRLIIKICHLPLEVRKQITNKEMMEATINVISKDFYDFLENKEFGFNFNEYPLEYIERIIEVIEKSVEIFKDNLIHINLGGSVGKSNVINGWSDLDVYIVLEHSNYDQMTKLFDINNDCNINVGITLYTKKEVINNYIDGKTKVMIYEKNKYKVNPTLYGRDIFNDIPYEVIKDNDANNFPNILHVFRREYIKIIKEEKNIDKKYIKQMLVLLKCILNINDTFSYGYEKVIKDFEELCIKKEFILKHNYSDDIINIIKSDYSKSSYIVELSNDILNFIENMFD